MKEISNSLLALALAFGMGSASAANYAWPEKYEGVMLQGFYWDSYTDTKWTNLTAQADELAESFDLIWVPNSAYAGGNQNMGYTPIYWFTQHNSSFGNEVQLRQMIEAFKERGTGIIADVVVNHRSGRTNWTDFPTEQWDGKTWHIGVDGICSNDEVANQPGQAKPTGARDTGENFDGSRDLDHTNANVQENVKNYTRCLLEKYGYTGFRYDMVKGYSAGYTKMYNEYSKPRFSVGEYFDGSYDAVAAWIEGTGRQSAAFDFPCKFAMNKAFGGNDMTQLVWKANGTTDQPAGMIHYGYQQYAVTFVDNHDTYRDQNKLGGNALAANAFILCSPGTPCVFLTHWKQYKEQIKQLIAVRKAAGVHNQSAVKVLRSSRDCYMAEVTGTKGSLVVRIGSSSDTPAGYTSADIKASGTGYCVWSKQGSQQTTTAPAALYLMGNIEQGAWKTNAGIAMKKDGNVFTANNVTISRADDSTKGFFSFVTALGTTGATTEWDEVINASDRYGAASKDEAIAAGSTASVTRYTAGIDASDAASWAIAPGTYNFTVDFEKMTLKVTGNADDPGDDPLPVTGVPSKLYLMGNIEQGAWITNAGIEMSKNVNVFTAENVKFLAAAGDTNAYFAFVTALGTTGDSSEWDSVINASDRYGATAKDTPLSMGDSAPFKTFQAGVDASSAYSWAVKPGSYTVKADFASKTVTLTDASGIEYIYGTDDESDAVYYNLQGMRVETPAHGVFVRVCGGKVSKVMLK